MASNPARRNDRSPLKAWWLLGGIALLLLPFLFVGSQAVNYQRYHQINSYLAHISQLNTALNQELLFVNRSPEHNYDRLVQLSEELRRSGESLWRELDQESLAQLQPQRASFDHLLQQKRELVEGFKLHYAIQKNSNNYFTLLAREALASRRASEAEAKSVIALQQAVHGFLIYGGHRHLEEVNALREQLYRQTDKMHRPQRDLYLLLHTHTGLIFRHGLEVSGLVDEILRTDLSAQVEILQQRLIALQEQQANSANHYRLALFLTALLLLVAVAYILQRQRRSMQELDRALNELEFQKRALDEHAIVSIADVQGNIIYANQKFCDISGYPLSELLGKNHRLLKSSEHSAEFYRDMWRAIANGRVWHDDIHNVSRSGDDYWVSSTIVPFLDAKGKPFRYVSIRTDITARKRMAQELARSHKFLTSITENIGECVYVLDNSGNCTFVNREAEQRLGWRREEMLGRNIHDLIHFQHADGTPMPQEQCPAHLSIARGERFSSETEYFTRKDGSLFPVAIVSVPLQEGEVISGSVTVFQDISARRRHEQELRNAKEQAEHASRMKSEFLANMSHEIRTPLNGMLGTIELLRDTPLNPAQYEYVEAAYRSSEHLLTLINDILDLSKLEAGSLTLESLDFDLGEALEDLADLYAANAQKKGLELVWGMAPEVPQWLSGDRVRLWQVLTNLTGNAVKFTEHGTVSVYVTLLEQSSTTTVLRFEVCDSGIGIAPEAQQRIFNAFEQADGSMTRRYGGTGLGLSLSKRLVEAMGGEIGVDSIPGSGSTFWFTVRLAPSQVIAVQSHEAQLQGKRVLIVDDVALNRLILERFVTQWQMVPHSVASAAEALQQLAEGLREGRPYALLLCDHLMPDIDGPTLARHIRADGRFGDTKLLLHSSEAEKQSQDPQLTLLFDAIVRKPLRRRTLHNQLQRLYDTGAAPEQAAPLAPTQSGWLHQRLLVVDDIDVNRMIVRGMLEKLGFAAIDMAENGEQALEMAQSHHYVMILMDVQMPVMDGHEATRALRRYEGAERHTTIIALTAHAYPQDIEQCYASGMDDFLSKPLQLAALQAMLDRWLPEQGITSTTPPAPLPPPAETSPPALSGVIDEAVLNTLAEVLGDEGIQLAVTTFVDDAPRQLETLQSAFDQRDWKTFTRAAHTLKGSSGSFGAKQLAALALQLEKLGRAESEDGVTALLEEINRHFMQVKEALHHYTTV